MKKIETALVTVGLLALPFVAAAQLGTIDDFFGRLSGFINNTLIPFVFALALLLFIWGMYRWFIQGGANETDREKGKQLTLYAIIAFVLMVGIWAIVNIIANGLFGTAERSIQQNDLPAGVELGGGADAALPGAGAGAGAGAETPPAFDYDVDGPQ